MPTQMGFDYMGMSYQEVKAAQGVSPATIFGLAFFVVFLIMAAQYESWTLPFSVLLGVPIAVFGAFVTLYLRKLDNNVYAQIGLVMLIGLSAKNAILIVEFAKMEYDKGATLIDAALTGAKLRLRPILMTSFAFLLGCVPLWTATGAGAISRRVLGSVVIGGMLAASFLAIFFIPVSFDVVERFGHWIGGKKEEPQPGQNQIRPQETPMTSLKTSVSHPVSAFAECLQSRPELQAAGHHVPDQYRGVAPDASTQPPAAQPIADMPWAAVYQDEVLQGLIKEALTNNYDIRIAATRVLQANANLGITRAYQFPM